MTTIIKTKKLTDPEPKPGTYTTLAIDGEPFRVLVLALNGKHIYVYTHKHRKISLLMCLYN